MTLVQQIIFITYPLAALIAMFGGWFAYQITNKCNIDWDDKIFMQLIIGLSIVLIFVIASHSCDTFKGLVELGIR